MRRASLFLVSLFLASCLFASSAYSAFFPDSGSRTVTGDWDWGGGVVQFPNSITLPATCDTGDVYVDTDAATTQRFYLCESVDTWVFQGLGPYIPRKDELLDAGTQSGTDFAAFTNSWTSSATTGNFFELAANSMTSGNAVTVSATAMDTGNILNLTVDNSMTTGKTLNVLGGSSGAVPILTVDDENVGIGTSAPAAKLDVAGQIRADSWGGTATGNSGIHFQAFGNSWTSSITNTTDFFTITAQSMSTGNVATIGVDSDAMTTGKALSVLGGTSGSIPVLSIDAVNVGIGTSAPAAKLDVAGQIRADSWGGTATGHSGFDLGATFTNSWTSSLNNTVDFFTIGAASLISGNAVTITADTSLSTGKAFRVLGGAAGTTPILTVDANNVGIGNSAPTSKLDITGELRAASWSGVATGNSGIDFVSFTNIWTSSLTAGTFFTIKGNDTGAGDYVMTARNQVTTNDKNIFRCRFIGDTVISTNDEWIVFEDSTGIIGDIDLEVAYNRFTGVHLGFATGPTNSWEYGMLLEVTGELQAFNTSGTVMTYVDITQSARSVNVMGAYSGMKDSEGWKYAKKEGETFVPFVTINALGDGAVLITDIQGEARNGDYITSSMIPGYGQKQDDDVVYNYTVAKITQDIDWANIKDYVYFQGKRYKRALVTCTYHAG